MKRFKIVSIPLNSEGEETLSGLVSQIELAPKSMEDQHLHIIATALKDYAFADILKATKSDLTMAVPILCTCFIEQMATFRYGEEVGVKQFKQFVNEYLSSYDANSLRNDLRNKLVHNYSVGKTYTLIKGHRQYHLKKSQDDNKVIINQENFVEDIGHALNRFLDELKTDDNIRSIALSALTKFPIVHIVHGNKNLC